MKKLMTLMLSGFALSSFAYVAEDTSKWKFGEVEFIVVSDEKVDTVFTEEVDDDKKRGYNSNDYARWAGIYYAVGGYMTPNNSFDMPEENKYLDLDYSKSFSMSWNLIESRFQLGTPHIGVTTGLGFEFNRYDFKRNVRLDYDADSIWSIYDSTVNYDKNFLKATYIQVPLLLSFATSKDPNKGFVFDVGVVGGYKIGSKMKIKYEEDGRDSKYRNKGEYNVNPFRLSATARLSIKHFTLYANYGLTSLFEKNRGPKVYPFSVGLSIIPFP